MTNTIPDSFDISKLEYTLERLGIWFFKYELRQQPQTLEEKHKLLAQKKEDIESRIRSSLRRPSKYEFPLATNMTIAGVVFEPPLGNPMQFKARRFKITVFRELGDTRPLTPEEFHLVKSYYGVGKNKLSFNVDLNDQTKGYVHPFVMNNTDSLVINRYYYGDIGDRDNWVESIVEVAISSTESLIMKLGDINKVIRRFNVNDVRFLTDATSNPIFDLYFKRAEQ